jgi:hypothetical protein
MRASVIWFQVSYQAALLLIHRPFLNEPAGSVTLGLALRSATSAASSISRILRDYQTHPGFRIVGPQIMEFVLSAAVVHLLNATAGRTKLGRQSASGLKSCLECLESMDVRWSVRVNRSVTRIRELADRWKVTWALPPHRSYPPVYPPTAPVIPVDSNPIVDMTPFDDTLNTDDYTNYNFDFSMDPTLAGIDLFQPEQYGGALDAINTAGDMEGWDIYIGNGNFDTQGF